jgi:hypothetical protein
MIIEVVNAANSWSILWEKLNFWEFVLIAISIFVLAAWIFSIIFILWWGLLLILSWGKDDKIKPAINTIRYAVIGIVVTVITIFAFPILWKLLWIDVEKYAKPVRIFEKIEEIWNIVFGNESSNIWNPSDINDFPADFSDL